MTPEEQAVVDAAAAWRDATVLEWNDPAECEALAEAVDALEKARAAEESIARNSPYGLEATSRSQWWCFDCLTAYRNPCEILGHTSRQGMKAS